MSATTAAPRLRIALDAAASGDDDLEQLAELLEEVEVEQERARRGSAS